MEISLTPERESQLAEVARRQGKGLADVASEAIGAWLDYRNWAAEVERKIEDAWERAEDPTTRWYSPEESLADLNRRKAEHLRERSAR
jgi:hypothetical protein